MKVCHISIVLLSVLSLVISYPLIKGKPNDTGTNLLSAPDPNYSDPGAADRCSEEGFGAITLDDAGVMHYFRGDYDFLGFQGPVRKIEGNWAGLTGPIDAAFRNHNTKKPGEHQRVYLFKGSQVWGFVGGNLVAGYPRLISKEFPGVPDNLDAATECHRGECRTDSVIFFKGDNVYVYSHEEKPPVKKKTWSSLGPCTAAIRWMDRYFCIKGTNFTSFDPVTGEVLYPPPLDTRDYFVRCTEKGHGYPALQNSNFSSIINRCSNRSFEALSSDDDSRTYAFRGGWYFRLDSRKDGWHPWPLSYTWRNLQGVVDAAFSYQNRIYFIQGSQVTVYKSYPMYELDVGYPKPIEREWKVPGLSAVDAAFTCPYSSHLYLIRGSTLILLDLNTRKRCAGDRTIIHSEVDSAMCNTHGLYLFQGPSFYHYKDVKELLSAKEAPAPENIASHFLDC